MYDERNNKLKQETHKLIFHIRVHPKSISEYKIKPNEKLVETDTLRYEIGNI